MLLGWVPGVGNRWCGRWDVWGRWGRRCGATCGGWWRWAVLEGRWWWSDRFGRGVAAAEVETPAGRCVPGVGVCAAMAVCTVESHKGWSGERGVYEVRE